jgi:hypothetical protein
VTIVTTADQLTGILGLIEPYEESDRYPIAKRAIIATFIEQGAAQARRHASMIKEAFEDVALLEKLDGPNCE